ncbi:uncharacterized protein LOC110870293 [Helianthus annuus]|uniref:uncharacterized protein LOC110870293 n=1 Tax=Helianthus annuus TaxID=4232 RepID=UPI000B8FF9A6|nr:uncharacterized protein LOC110870293 [Helianthus annuus]
MLIKEGDVWKWRNDPSGSFSVKQVRLDIENASIAANSNDEVFHWNNWAPPKSNYLLWRAIMGKVAAKTELIHRGVRIGDCLCPRCGLSDESPDHLFVSCLWSQSVWWNVLSWVRIPFPLNTFILKDMIGFLKLRQGGGAWKKIIYMIAIGTVWRLWNARNTMAFEGKFIPVATITDQIKEDTFLWLSNRSKIKTTSWEKWRSFDVLDML